MRLTWAACGGCIGAGLNLLLELLVMFERSEYATQFHQTYYLQLMREIFVVMTGALPAHPLVPALEVVGSF